MVVVVEISVVLTHSSHFLSSLLSIFTAVNCYFRPVLLIQKQTFYLFTNNILIIFLCTSSQQICHHQFLSKNKTTLKERLIIKWVPVLILGNLI